MPEPKENKHYERWARKVAKDLRDELKRHGDVCMYPDDVSSDLPDVTGDGHKTEDVPEKKQLKGIVDKVEASK